MLVLHMLAGLLTKARGYDVAPRILWSQMVESLQAPGVSCIYPVLPRLSKSSIRRREIGRKNGWQHTNTA